MTRNKQPVLPPQQATQYDQIKDYTMVDLHLPAVWEATEYFGSCIVPCELKRADYGFEVIMATRRCSLVPIFSWEDRTYAFKGWLLLDPTNRVTIAGVGIHKP